MNKINNKIKNKKYFKLNAKVLLDKIQKKIESLSGAVKAYDKKENERIIDDLNKIKIHEFKMKNAIERLRNIDASEWQKQKTYFFDELELANQTLRMIN